jgi:hypothetical protein
MQQEAESDQNAIERAKMEEFIARLHQCQSRDLIDQVQTLCCMNRELH